MVNGFTKADAHVNSSHSVIETETLTYVATAYDPDGDDVSINAEDLPTGATLGTTTSITAPSGADPSIPSRASWWGASLLWTPAVGQAGDHNVWIHAVDVHGADTWEIVQISVVKTNLPPVFLAGGDAGTSGSSGTSGTDGT